MSWDGARRLILPAALTLTSVAIGGCSSETEKKNKVEELACADVVDGGCQRCRQPDGGVDCVGNPDCYYDPVGDRCDDAVA
jgi:hypothetical protein